MVKMRKKYNISGSGKAQVRVSTRNESCTTNSLPAGAVPSTGEKEWVILDNAEALGTCWNFTITEEVTGIEVKLPISSSLDVSSVKVLHVSKSERCFKSKFKNVNFKMQKNEFVKGSQIETDRMCEI